MKRNKWLYKYKELGIDYDFWMFSRFKTETPDFYIQDKRPHNSTEVAEKFPKRVIILETKDIEKYLKKSKLKGKYKKIIRKYYG